MKKVLVSILLSTITISTYATSMCVYTGAFVVTISRSKNAMSYSAGNDGTWTATFNYPLSNKTNNNNIMVGSWGCGDTGSEYENTAVDGYSTSWTDIGNNCWCAMSSPVASDWVFVHTYADDTTCASSCATECATRAGTNTAFRTAMLDSIW